MSSSVPKDGTKESIRAVKSATRKSKSLKRELKHIPGNETATAVQPPPASAGATMIAPRLTPVTPVFPTPLLPPPPPPNNHNNATNNLTMLPPLVVDAALLRQRQLAVVAASNAAAALAPPPPQLPPNSHSAAYPPPSLRSGKWLPAEENYALLLVALFERGMIEDCIDGTTTLRTYLAQKLHCAPMRISKKFAGRGIGKLIYTCSSSKSRSSMMSMNHHHHHATASQPPQITPELLLRLRLAEQQFLQSAYPQQHHAVGGMPVPFPLLQVAPTIPAPPPIPVLPSSMMPGMVLNPAAMVPPQPMVIGSSHSIPAQGHTLELHQSYLRALEQVDDDESNVEGKPPPPSSSHPPALTATVHQATTEIPDLLSGFEKVVQDMNVGSATSMSNNTTTTTPPEYSPPFTSRSFDEFHRFLGKDEISLLDTASTLTEDPPVTQNSHVTAAAIMDPASILPTPAIALDTDALFTAESYALLVEASGSASDLPLFPIRGGQCAYEVENILHQVQQTHPNSDDQSTCYESFVHENAPTFPGHSTKNPPTDVTFSHRPSNVGPLSTPSTTRLCYTDNVMATAASLSNRNHHVTASSQSEDANIVSGSEPSGGSSSSSRSNTSHTSSGTDTAGTTSNDDDDGSEEGLMSSGGEFDSAEDDDGNIHNQNGADPPPRKRAKGSHMHPQRSEHGKAKRVQFQ